METNTGVAAINARGVTIHSFFQLPPTLQIGIDRIKPENFRFGKEKRNIIRSLDLLVIDEISMVRADLLDAIDLVLRRNRSNNRPFGGVQLLMIGDLQQLSPIVKDDERAVIDAEAAFAHEQVYVAISRCKTLEGMILSSPISAKSIINDLTIKGFTSQIEQNQPDEETLNIAQKAYQQEQLADLFRFGLFRNRISFLGKIVGENSGSFQEPTKALINRLLAPVNAEIIEVSEKFHNQINRLLPQEPDIEKNSALQERIGKAAAYFSGKIKTLILDELRKVDTDIDNKTVKKQFTEALGRLESDAQMKYDSLRACLSGFYLSEYLHARALAAIEKEKRPASRAKVVAEEITEIEHPALFENLRAWRYQKSAEMVKPAFVIFSQKALYELVHYLPQDKCSLLKINGIGEAKVKQYGGEILGIIREFCEGKI